MTVNQTGATVRELQTYPSDAALDATVATMEQQSKMHSSKTIVETLTVPELDEVIDRASTLLSTRNFRFLDLPPELRNRIYRFAVQPEDIRKHVKEGSAPALLKVNRQIFSEFIGLYYSQESMAIEIYDAKTMSWIHEQDTGFFRIILARRSECHIVKPYTRASKVLKAYLEGQEAQRSEHEWRPFHLGIFTWNGGGYLCSYWKDGIKMERTLRELEAERMHKEASIQNHTTQQ
jgi:hypothetical protein